MDRLTTVLVTYDGHKKYIGETLESLKANGITPVIVDNGRKNYENWSDAIANCETEYLFLPHSDDVYLPEFAKEVVACLDAHPDAAACFTLDYIVDEKGRRIGNTALPFPPLGYYDFGFVFENMGKFGNFLRCPSVVFRVGKVKGLRYPTHCGTANDTAMWYNVLNVAPICIVPKPLYLYRQHSKSDTQANVVGSPAAYDHVLAMEYATKLRPEVKTYLAHIAIAKGMKGRADAVEEERLRERIRAAKCTRLLVCHEAPDNAGTGVLVSARVRGCNEILGDDITYYVYPGEIEKRGIERGCPTIQIPPQQFFRLVGELKPVGIEHHHLLRWPLDILDAPAPDRSVYLHDSFLWCSAYHSFNGKEVCNQPEEAKCLACSGIPIEAYRKKKEYLKRILPTMKVYANSPYTAMYASLHLGCKVDVHTFDVPPLPKPFKGKRVGYFGGWYPVKGIDTLMEVALRMPDVQFLLFTNPPEGMMDGSGIYGYENILVMGGYRRGDLPVLSNLIDVGIVTSKNESFGLVAREIRSMDIPVVASRVGGLDGSISPGDIGGFVTEIRRLLA